MKRNKVFVAIALMGGLMACTPGGKTATDEVLVMDSLGAERSDEVASVQLHVVYPTSGPATLVDSLRCFIVQTIQDGAWGLDAPAVEVWTDGDVLPTDGKELLTSIAGQEYNRMKAEHDEMANSFDGDVVDYTVPAFESSYDITRLAETDKYLTLGVQHYEYLGGAHGSTFIGGTTFRKADGRQLDWSLLTDTGNPAFLQLIRNGVRSYFQEVSDETVTDEELTDWLLLEPGATEIPLPGAPPYLTSEGVAFVYQQYEIAPYAAGLPSFTVSYDEIQPFLSDEALQLITAEQE